MITCERVSEVNEAFREYLTLFQTPVWLKFIKNTQGADPVIIALMQDGCIAGYFIGCMVKKFGIRILGSPFPGWTTGYMGFCLSNAISPEKALFAVTDYAFHKLGCMHIEIMDKDINLSQFYAISKKYPLSHRIFGTFEIDLTQSPDILLGKMNQNRRRNLKAAKKNGITIEEAPMDTSFVRDYHDNLIAVFKKQHSTPTYDEKRVKALIDTLGSFELLLLLRIYNRDRVCIATGIFPAWNSIAYFWGGASIPAYNYLRPNESMHWYAMMYWKTHGMRIYNMGGGGEYKKKYGGTTIETPWVRISRYKPILFLRTYAEKLHKSLLKIPYIAA